MKKKRVVIDASLIFTFGEQCLPGIGRTTLELIKALEQIEDLPFELVLFGQRFSNNRFQRYGFASPVRYLRLPRWKCFNWLREKLPIVEFLTRSDLLHVTSNHAPVFAPHRTVVTIHDAMFLCYPEEHLHREKESADILTLAKACRAIITCSENSKKDLVNYGRIAERKIHVIHWGYDQTLFFKIPDPAANHAFLANRFQIVSPYFLSVSCDIGRKNSPAIVNNFLMMKEDKTRHDLVMVWKNPLQEIKDQVAAHRRGKRVHFLSNISDEELRHLYNGATALLFPSEYEGFGLPVLEAMACGTPVITCNASSLPEVGGNAAIYIAPGDHLALLGEMEAFTQGKYNREELGVRCLTQAKKFSWSQCALKTIAVYSSISAGVDSKRR